MAINSSQTCSVCGRPVGRDEGRPLGLMEEIATHRRTVESEGEGRE